MSKSEMKQTKLTLGFCILILTILSILILSCKPIDINQYKKSESENNLQFEILANSQYNHHKEKKNYVIKNNNDWKELWIKVHGSGGTPLPPLPEIDFDKNIVIAAFLGEKTTGGYSIEIERVIESENKILVFIKEKYPGSNCMVTMAFTSPFQIIRIKQTDKEVLFETKKEVVDCSKIEGPTTKLSPTELKYLLEEKLGKAIFCGPPVVTDKYDDELLAQFSTVRENTEEFLVILKSTNIVNDGQLSNEEKLTVVREHNRMSVINLEEAGSGRYKFTLYGRPSQEKSEFIFEGFVTLSGQIDVTKKEANLVGCPICLASNTLIDTPNGSVPIQNIMRGMFVLTADSFGNRLPAIVMDIAKTPVASGHQILHIMLNDGRELFSSAGHPTADGRTIGSLSVGDILDGTVVVMAKLIPYGEDYTYDILPHGKTGAYWANEILIGSTLTSSRTNCK